MQKLAMRLAVALITVTGISCAVEHEEDGAVDLGQCDCEVKASLWVNSLHGGEATCLGETWNFSEGVRIHPICMTEEGIGFTVHIQAQGEAWIEGWILGEDPAGHAMFNWEWLGEGSPPEGFPSDPASEVYLPSGGTVNAVVPPPAN